MGRRSAEPVGPSGLLVVDKPAGFTSHDVVARLRRLTGTRRVGHAGTLDPMATGVLILGVNKATKLLTWITGESKTYETVIRLGRSTVTDDAEGEATATAGASAMAAATPEAIAAAVRELTGEILQAPSAVSAIKVDGQRSYARVRSGEEVSLRPRPVTVSEFSVHAVHPAETADGSPVLDVAATVSCSSGTYVRALARDLGEALGTGGHLTALRRTRIGEVGLADAVGLEELAARRERGEPLPLLPLEEAARRLFRVRELSAEEAGDVSQGRWIAPTEGSVGSGSDAVRDREPGRAEDAGTGVVPASDLAAAFAPGGELVALVQDQRRRGRDVAVPHLVFLSGRTFGESS